MPQATFAYLLLLTFAPCLTACLRAQHDGPAQSHGDFQAEGSADEAPDLPSEPDAVADAGLNPEAEDALNCGSKAIDAQRVMDRHCGACHGLASDESGFGSDASAWLDEGFIIPDDPDNSPLYLAVSSGAMPPPGQPRLDADETAAIRSWMRCGYDGWACKNIGCANSVDFVEPVAFAAEAFADADVEVCLNEACWRATLKLSSEAVDSELGRAILVEGEPDAPENQNPRGVGVYLMRREDSLTVEVVWNYGTDAKHRVGDKYAVTVRAVDGTVLLTFSKPATSIDEHHPNGFGCGAPCATPTFD